MDLTTKATGLVGADAELQTSQLSQPQPQLPAQSLPFSVQQQETPSSSPKDNPKEKLVLQEVRERPPNRTTLTERMRRLIMSKTPGD